MAKARKSIRTPSRRVSPTEASAWMLTTSIHRIFPLAHAHILFHESGGYSWWVTDRLHKGVADGRSDTLSQAIVAAEDVAMGLPPMPEVQP